MGKQIKDALENAVEKDNDSPELSARVKKLLARKKNLRRKTHNPKRVRRDK
tara:strand:+ start:265 stop:417 length:153 start_codon:yes stop_codon:yes gene_type:complete